MARAANPRTHSRSIAAVVFLVVGPGLPYASAEDVSPFTKWKHFVIAESLPGSAWGTGGIAVADFDGDGDIEIALSRREPQTAYCFERKTDSNWLRHEIGTSEKLKRTLGAAALDMDQDGWIDVAFWGVWFKNPGKSALKGTRWKAIGYDGGGHDVVAADVNGDGTLDLVTYDGHDLCWFDPANKLAKTTVVHNREDHGGIAPRGIGDLNGDGRADIVVPGVWLENSGSRDPTWRQHPWPHLPVDKASYGTSMRAWIADINSDGHNDIVYSDCDTGFSHVYWVANGGKGNHWTRHQLSDPPGDERTGSFHSLAVVDFDRDGRLEIFAGEQEDPDTYMTANGLLPMKPRGLKERGVIWVGTNEADVEFTPVVIHTDNPGWHDAVVFDVDGDGDADIVSKVWNADGLTYHVDYWRNDIKNTR